MLTEGHLVIYVFLGFVVGSVPSLIKEANSNGFRKLYIIPMVFAFLIVTAIGLIPVGNGGGTGGDSINASLNISFYIGNSTLIPGVVASFILIALAGMKNDFTIAIRNSKMLLISVQDCGYALLITELVDFIFRNSAYAYYAVWFPGGFYGHRFPGLQQAETCFSYAALYLSTR